MVLKSKSRAVFPKLTVFVSRTEKDVKEGVRTKDTDEVQW